MNRSLLQLYHRLPPPLQDLAATLRGGRLQAWRYGPETERLVAEALEREAWTTGRWREWQEAQLARALHRAATRVPFYRAQWQARRRRGDQADWEVLAHWPELSKEDVRSQPRAFLADDCNPARMFEEHTSGSTGTSLRLWWSRATVRNWYALFEARWRRWYGVSRHDRWALLGGQLVTSPERATPPFWVHNHAMHQLYLSAHHIGPRTGAACMEAIARHGARYLYGYPSALLALAQAGAPYRGPPLAVVLTNGEPLPGAARAVIAQAFGCPVRETYGLSEIVAAASECDGGHLHAWPEAGVLEVLDDAVDDGAGRLVATGLLNLDMPLVRYAPGDRIRPGTGGPCACGRGLPRIAGVVGREDDVLEGPDGRQVGRLDPVFKAELRVREAQVRQEARDRLRVLVVPAEGYGERDARIIVDGLRQRLGQVTVSIETVAAIPRGAAGKFRAVVSEVPPRAKQE